MNRFEVVYEEDDEILVGYALLNEVDYEEIGREIMGELPYVTEIKLEDGKIIMSLQIIAISHKEEN